MQSSKRRPGRKTAGVTWTPATVSASAKGKTLAINLAGKITVLLRTGLNVRSPKFLE